MATSKPNKAKAPKPMRKITRLAYLKGDLASDSVRSRISSQQPAKFSKVNVIKPTATTEGLAA